MSIEQYYREAATRHYRMSPAERADALAAESSSSPKWPWSVAFTLLCVCAIASAIVARGLPTPRSAEGVCVSESVLRLDLSPNIKAISLHNGGGRHSVRSVVDAGVTKAEIRGALGQLCPESRRGEMNEFKVLEHR